MACACIDSQDAPLFSGSIAQSRVRLVGVPREGDQVNASGCVRSDSPPAAPVEASMQGTAILVLEPKSAKKPPPSGERNKVLNPCGSDTTLAASGRPSSVPYADFPAGEHVGGLPGAQVPPCLDAKLGAALAGCGSGQLQEHDQGHHAPKMLPEEAATNTSVHKSGPGGMPQASGEAPERKAFSREWWTLVFPWWCCK